MQNELFEKITEAHRASYATMQKLGEINTKALRELTELQLGWATYNVERGVEYTKMLGDTSSYNDLLNAETGFNDQYNAKLMELGRKAVDILTESRDEMVTWFEQSVESPTGKSKKPAAKRSSGKKAA